MSKKTRRQRRAEQREKRIEQEHHRKSRDGAKCVVPAESQRDSEDKSLIGSSEPPPRWLFAFRTVWPIFAAILSVFGVGIALYESRPILNVSRSDSLNPSDPYLQFFNLDNAGLTAAREVSVSWITNKVIFSNGDTFSAPKVLEHPVLHTELIDSGGETSVRVSKIYLTAYESGNQTDIVQTALGANGQIFYVVVHGVAAPGDKDAPKMTVEFVPSYTLPAGGTVLFPVRADMTMVVRYKLVTVPWIPQEHRFRFTAALDSSRNFVWFPSPLDAPPLSDLLVNHKAFHMD